MDPEVLERLRRNSGLRVDREGTFYFHDAPVPNARVQRLFHEGLHVREDGEVVLTVGPMWAYVGCDGVARFVDGVRAEDGRMVLRLRDGREAGADPSRLAVGPDERFYVWPEGDGAPAVLTRNAHQQLVGWLTAGDDEGLVLPWGDRHVVIPTLSEPPGPAASWPL